MGRKRNDVFKYLSGLGVVYIMSYLIVVAHPDDEVLGAGATIYRASQKGEQVYVCIMSGGVTARSRRPTTDELTNDLHDSSKELGVKEVFSGDFLNIKMNNAPHLELVEFIEDAIMKTDTDIIFTHHPSDTNNDHLHTSLACQAAIRLFQRKDDVVPIRDFLYMEVPSSTEWGVNRGFNPFTPNTFVEAGADGVSKKIEALSKYRGVMRSYPHPRSDEAIRSLAAYRGSQSGLKYAEAFESAFRRIKL